MRKGPKSAAVLAVMVITVFALYYYLVNKVERSDPEVETSAVEDVLLKIWRLTILLQSGK